MFIVSNSRRDIVSLSDRDSVRKFIRDDAPDEVSISGDEIHDGRGNVFFIRNAA